MCVAPASETLNPYPKLRLRRRIVSAYEKKEGGKKCLAKRFSVALSTVKRIVKIKMETGDTKPKPHGGGVKHLIPDLELQSLRDLVAKISQGACEDGNSKNGDGCSTDKKTEAGWICLKTNGLSTKGTPRDVCEQVGASTHQYETVPSVSNGVVRQGKEQCDGSKYATDAPTCTGGSRSCSNGCLVKCTPNQLSNGGGGSDSGYTFGGTIAGLTGTFVLGNGWWRKTITANDSYAFTGKVPSGQAYNVVVV